ncbi:MAG: YfiT family bacillithiol transferase [Acidobacteriota bacterium]
MTSDDRYPIGPFRMEGDRLAADERARSLAQIAEAPARLREAVAGFSEAQLDTPYREGGWTVRQVVHHVPDSHINAYTRFKLALTEPEPVIRTYEEGEWAKLDDARTAPVGISLDLLDALHARWMRLLTSLGPSDFERRFRHPESGPAPLDRLVALYAWHGRHHVEHIASLARRRGWR